MRISNNINNTHNTNNRPNFNAIIMSPKPEAWDQRVLRSVLNSKTITSIIKENEKIGENTELRFYKYSAPRYPESPASDDIYLNVNGKSGKVALSSHSTYKFIPGSFFENKKAKEVIHGPADIADDLVNQIDAIDHRSKNDPAPNGIDYLKTLASEIIYEPAVEVNPY